MASPDTPKPVNNVASVNEAQESEHYFDDYPLSLKISLSSGPEFEIDSTTASAPRPELEMSSRSYVRKGDDKKQEPVVIVGDIQPSAPPLSSLGDKAVPPLSPEDETETSASETEQQRIARLAAEARAINATRDRGVQPEAPNREQARAVFMGSNPAQEQPKGRPSVVAKVIQPSAPPKPVQATPAKLQPKQTQTVTPSAPPKPIASTPIPSSARRPAPIVRTELVGKPLPLIRTTVIPPRASMTTPVQPKVVATPVAPTERRTDTSPKTGTVVATAKSSSMPIRPVTLTEAAERPMLSRMEQLETIALSRQVSFRLCLMVVGFESGQGSKQHAVLQLAVVMLVTQTTLAIQNGKLVLERQSALIAENGQGGLLVDQQATRLVADSHGRMHLSMAASQAHVQLKSEGVSPSREHVTGPMSFMPRPTAKVEKDEIVQLPVIRA